MSDIFISYSNEDRLRAEKFVEALAGVGWSVFWDRTIPTGKTWRETIGKELREARCVIVLWSKTSIESGWVQEEADDAKRRGILVPVLIENVAPPIGFRSIQAADLVNSNDTVPTPGFDRLTGDIAALIGRPSPAPRQPRPSKGQRGGTHAPTSSLGLPASGNNTKSKEIIAFFSYSNKDDQASGGILTKIGKRLEVEVQILAGREDVSVCYDCDIDSTETFIIQMKSCFCPVLTPFYFNLPMFRKQMQIWLDNAYSGIGHIVPIEFIPLGQSREGIGSLSDPLRVGMQRFKSFNFGQYRNLRSISGGKLVRDITELAQIISGRRDI